jgi:hypothetical protein
MMKTFEAKGLTQRYATAMKAFGVSVREAPGDAVFLGLLAIVSMARR